MRNSLNIIKQTSLVYYYIWGESHLQWLFQGKIKHLRKEPK